MEKYKVGAFFQKYTMTIALVLVPYIQSGDRALSSVYSVAFVGSALLVFFLFEGIIHNLQKGEDPL